MDLVHYTGLIQHIDRVAVEQGGPHVFRAQQSFEKAFLAAASLNGSS